jgi:hypothetical protein
MVKQKSFIMTKNIISVKDFYKNIKGVGKVKELTKGNIYEDIDNSSMLFTNSSFLIKNDLGETKRYYKMNMFMSESKYKMLNRDKLINSILD